jgi:hypothetical protein
MKRPIRFGHARREGPPLELFVAILGGFRCLESAVMTTTAYRCSPGRRGSFISPTFGVAKLSFLPLSNMSRQSANSSGASVAASKPWYRSHPSKVSN